MATAQAYADWLRGNQDKRDSPDYQTVLRAFQEARLEELQAKATPPAPQAQPQSGFMPALKAGATELGGGISALMGKVGLKDAAKAEAEYQAAKKRAGEIFKPTEEGWTEAPLTKFTELLGGSLPYMAAPLAAGAAAATLPISGTAATIAGLGAAGLTSAGQFTATNLARQMEGEEGTMPKKSLGETSLGSAFAAAVPQALLDTAAMRMIPGIGRIFGQAGVKVTAENAKEIAEQGLKKTLADYAAKTGKAAGIEGVTEASQQVFERLQAGLNITDAKARQEYFDSFIGGVVLGGTLAPVGRAVERGGEKREARGLLEKQAQEERAATLKAEEERKKTPEYLLDLDTQYSDAVTKMRELQTAVKQKPAKDADPAQWTEYNQKVAELKEFTANTMRPLTAEYTPRKAEIAKMKEQQRVAGMTPLEYQMEQAGVDLTEPPKEERVFTGEETLPAAPAPEVEYAQQQMSLAQQQDLGTFEAKDFAEYLMQDPLMAQRLVETKTVIPGVSKKESDAILGGLKLQLKDRVKQAQAATAEQLQQQQADLSAQQQPAEVDPLAMWRTSVEETEDQATEELLRPNFETLRPSGPATVAVAPGIAPMQNPETLLKRLDDLTAARDRAAADADTAFAAGNKELGIKKSQEREAAQAALNNVEQVEGTPRALMSLRKAQDAALMNTAQLADDLRVGRTLGGPEAGTASSTPQTLINQINKQRDAFVTAAVQESAATRRLFGKSLTQEEAETAGKEMRDVFNEWVTRSMAQPAKAVDWTDRLLAQMQAERAVEGKALKDAPWVQTMKQDFIRAQMTDALTQRLGRQRMEEIAKGTVELKGAETELPADTRRAIQSKASVDFDRLLKTAQEKALAQSTDPRPLEERRFGAYRAATAVLQEQLQGIAAKLKEVPRAPQRVEPTLKMQFPETEAAKVAEASGETAQTLEGSLRRRRDYVGGLIDQAFQTRKVPGIAQMLLTRAQDFTPNATNNFLDAAENIASRILRGQNVERGDLVAMRDEIRAASMRPGEAEVAGEREGQRELFPAEERRALAPKAEQGALGTIREKPAAFQAVRGKEAAKQARVDAAAQRSEQITADIRAAWADLEKQRREAADAQVEERRDSLQSAWQSAVKKSKNLVLSARKAAQKPQVDALKKEIDAIRKGGIEGLNKETIDRLLATRAELDKLSGEFDTVVEAAEFLPAALANKWVAFEKGALAAAEEARDKLPQPATQATVQQQKAALARAEQSRLQSLKGEERKAEQQRMQARQAGLGLPGQRRVEGRVEPITPEQTAEQKRADAEERRQQERAETVAAKATRDEQRSTLEQRVTDLTAQVTNAEAAQKRARTPASKERLQESINTLNKDLTLARSQLEAFGETKPRKKGPATVVSGAGLAKQRPLRTGYRKTLESAAEGMRREREESVDIPGTFEFGPQDALFTAKRPPMSADAVQAARAARETTGMPRIEDGAPDSAFYKASGFEPDASAPFHKMTLADAARFGASKARGQRKELFTRLADLFDEATTPEKQGLVFATNGRGNPQGAAGAFYRKSNVIFTPSTSRTNYLETLLHELTHAASWYALSVDKRLAGRVESLRRKAVAWAETKEGKAYIRKHSMSLVTKDPQGKRGIYGLKNIDEFLSELYADREFQKFLTQIPSDAPKKNLLTRFVEFMSSFFSAPNEAQQSIFAEAVALSEEVLETTRQEIYGTDVELRDVRRGMFPFGKEGPPDVAFSAKLPIASRVADSLIAKEKGFFTKLKENFLGMGARTQFVDKLAPTEEALKRGGSDPTKALQAMYFLRMYDQRMHFTSQSITEGVPQRVEKTRRDGTKEYLIETQPGANIKQIVDILKAKDVVKAAGSADAANKLFTLYLAAIRGERVGYDKLNFKASEADIKAARAEIEAEPALKKAFDEARDIYNQYNRNLLEFSVQAGALSRAEANRLLANNDYIPYYRMRDGVAEMVIGGETPIRIGNLKDSPHLKELVGGDEAIFDFLTSSVQNTSMLLDMATKNLAVKNLMFELRDVGLATVAKVPKSGKTPEGAVTFKRDGEDYFAVVDTDTIGIDSDLLVKGLAGIPTMFPAFVRVLGIPSRFLRRVVVASPVYMARQLFRDSLAASLTSGANITPVLGALKQIGKPNVLQGRGITGGQVFTGMPEDVTRMLKDMQAGKISLHNGLAWLEAKSAQADALTRKAQYESYLAQGLSEMEATYMSLESMNFSKRGLSPTMHMVSTLIPFFNAQIQGLDVLYKAFTGQMPMNERLAVREKLWTRGMMLFGMSMVYALYMQDDETYKNAKPEQKYGNWFVRVPGFEEMVRLPIPFELGYLFKALPEALVNTMSNEQGGEEAMKAFKHIAQQMIPGGSSYMIPQAVKPVLETVIGTSIYTGRGIESAKEQMLEPGYRARDNTTALAREIGELTGFSPIKMEYLLNGYTGSMGMALLAALSAPFGKDDPEAATKRMSEIPMVGTLFQAKDASGIIDATYERMKQINQVKETYEGLLEKGRQADAQKYLTENINEMALASVAGSFKQYMGQITEFERGVRASNMTPDEKRKQLDAARQMKINLAASVRAVADRKTPQAAPV